MNEHFERLARIAHEASVANDHAQANLIVARHRCKHDWSDPKYDPIVREACTIPGDPSLTLGVDRQHAHYAPRSEKARWKRTCHTCGQVEYTQDFTSMTHNIPHFASSIKKVPRF